MKRFFLILVTSVICVFLLCTCFPTVFITGDNYLASVLVISIIATILIYNSSLKTEKIEELEKRIEIIEKHIDPLINDNKESKSKE